MGGLILDKKLLGRYIKIYRIKKGLTQAELAESVNVAVGTLGQYERGEKAPGRDMVFELANVLGFSLDALILKHELSDEKILSQDFVEKLNKLTAIEQRAALRAAEAVIDTFLEE